MTACRPATSVRRPIQSRGPRKSETTTTTPGRAARGADERQGAGRRRPAGRALVRRFGRERPEQAQHPAATAGGRADPLLAVTERDDAEPVPAAGGEPPDHERGPLGHVGLAPIGRAEVHRRGAVEQQPRRQLTIRHVLADLRHEGSRRRVPVDPAHVIPRLVRSDPIELEAVPPTEAEVIATALPADTAVERELQLAHQPVGDGSGAGTSGRPLPTADVGQIGGAITRRGHAVGSTAMSRRGAGTSVRTRPTIVSALMPSASAA